LQRVFNGPDGVLEGQVYPLDGSVTQFEAKANEFWSLGERNRLFVGGGIGTGPALLAGSAGFDGRWRTYVGIGRIFR
jgi:hypothetical protein